MNDLAVIDVDFCPVERDDLHGAAEREDHGVPCDNHRCEHDGADTFAAQITATADHGNPVENLIVVGSKDNWGVPSWE